MWKILHQLFGWHYVRYEDSATSFTIRVKVAPNGRLYIRDWTDTYFRFLDGNGRFVNNSARYTPLTFDEKQTNEGAKE